MSKRSDPNLIRAHEAIHGSYPESAHVRNHRERGHRQLAEDDNFRSWNFAGTDAIDDADAVKRANAVGVLTIDVAGGETLFEQRTYRFIPHGDLLAPPQWMKLMAKTRADGRVSWIGRFENAEGATYLVMGGVKAGWVAVESYRDIVTRLESGSSEMGVLSEPSITTGADFQQFMEAHPGAMR